MADAASFRSSECAAAAPVRETRTAKLWLLFPRNLRNALEERCQPRAISVSDVLVRFLELGVSTGAIAQAYQAAPVRAPFVLGTENQALVPVNEIRSVETTCRCRPTLKEDLSKLAELNNLSINDIAVRWTEYGITTGCIEPIVEQSYAQHRGTRTSKERSAA